MHFDATGSILPPQNGKRVFLYSLVAPTEGKEPCLPLLEFISNSHTTQTIAEVLFSWRTLAGKICKIDTIVTDFSFALINAVSESFNNNSSEVQLCQQWSLMCTNQEPQITIVQLCVSHYIKLICQKLSKLKLPKQVS